MSLEELRGEMDNVYRYGIMTKYPAHIDSLRKQISDVETKISKLKQTMSQVDQSA